MTNRGSTAKAILLIFFLCTVSDFVWGYIHGRSIPAGVISIFGGLFGTACYLLLFWWSQKDEDKPDASRR
jgi:O-antigen/teichoic acid export membrane protein